MSFTVDQLVGRVAPYRPDRKDSWSWYAIQEAVRRVCRNTGLAVETLTPVELPIYTQSITATPSNGNDLYRVNKVRIAPVPPDSSYQGTWNASTNVPSMAAASSGNNLYFFIVSEPGTTTVDGQSLWARGDIIYSNGSKWDLLELQSYETIKQLNKPTIDTFFSTVQEDTGFPYGWTQEGNRIDLYPRTQCDMAIEITLSYIPVGEIDTIPLPVEAEDVIVAGALSELLYLPGTGQNLKLGQSKEIEFKRGLSNLRALSTIGFGGSAYYILEDFTGRT